jgi:PPOX class probable FMN-dependent enzyme
MNTQDSGQPDLDALYSPPSEMIRKAVLHHLADFHQAYLAQATFFCLSTGSERGLDASPRGGPPGFVKVLDPHTIAFADWPGNNRIESLRNLQLDDRLAMVFIFPGLEIFLRINGRGRISADPGLMETLAEGDRIPKTATVVRIDEVLMHCGKAIHRARLWEDASRLDDKSLPTVGRMMAELARLEDAGASWDESRMAGLDAHYAEVVRRDLY